LGGSGLEAGQNRVTFVSKPVCVFQRGSVRERELIVAPVVELDHQLGVMLHDRAKRDLLRLISDERAGRR
jgi:hypothetical protein